MSAVSSVETAVGGGEAAALGSAVSPLQPLKTVASAVLLACLHIIADRKFSRESNKLCALNKALWNDQQHLRAVCRLKYSVTISTLRLSTFAVKEPPSLPVSVSRLAVVMVRGDGTRDHLAAERARTLIEAGGCAVGNDELALACKSGLHECLAVLVAHPGLEPAALNSASAMLATKGNAGGHPGGLPMAPLSYVVTTGDARSLKVLLSHPSTDPTILGPGTHHRLLDFLEYAGEERNIRIRQAAVGSAASAAYVERLESRYQQPLETTPLGLAAFCNCSPEVCALLLADPRVDANAGQIDKTHSDAMLHLPPADIEPGTPTTISPLHLAVSRSNGRAVLQELLLHTPAVDINLLDEQHLTAAAKAALYGQEELLALLILAGADMTLGSLALSGPSDDGQDTTTDILLQRTINAGRSECALLLLDHPACRNINGMDRSRHTALAPPEGLSALHAAAIKGLVEVVARLLLRPDLQVNTKSGMDGTGLTAIRLAARHRHPAVVKMILSHADIDRDDALESASELGLYETVSQLLSIAPFSPAVLSRALCRVCTGRIVFSDYAAEDEDADHSHTLKAILAAPGLEINSPLPVLTETLPLSLHTWGGGWAGAPRRSALAMAVESKQGDLVRTLLSVPGIRVQSETIALLLKNEALPPSQLFGGFGQPTPPLLPKDLTELVLRAPIDMSNVSGYWHQLCSASQYQRPRLLAKLFECYGVVKYVPWPASLDSPLYNSCRWGLADNVAVMLQHPDIVLHINAPASEEGWTPLIAASRGDHVRIVDMLIRLPGLDANLADDDGFTALTWAVHEGRASVVPALLAIPGLDLEVASREGFTAYSYAQTWGDGGAMAAQLEGAGARKTAPAVFGPPTLPQESHAGPDQPYPAGGDNAGSAGGGAVVRKPSSFIRFCTAKRDEVKRALPGASFGELGQRLGLMWRSLTDEEKQSYSE